MPLGDGILNCPGGTLARTLTNKPCKLTSYFSQASKNPGGGVLPYKGLMGTCGQPGYVFRDFCLKQGIESGAHDRIYHFSVLIRVSIYQFLS